MISHRLRVKKQVHRTLQDVPIVEIPQNIDDYKISNEVSEGLNPEVFNGI